MEVVLGMQGMREKKKKEKMWSTNLSHENMESNLEVAARVKLKSKIT